MSSRIRLFFVGATEVDARFLFAFSKAFAFSEACPGARVLALRNFYLSRPLRSGEAQGMKYPIPADSAEVSHQGLVFVPRNRSDHLVSPALDNGMIYPCIAEEAQTICNVAGSTS